VSARSIASPNVVSIHDFRPLAQHRLPKAVFDYLDGGADGEMTLRENCRAFNDVTFRPRCAVAFKECNLKTNVLGFELSFPAMLAPVGYSRLMHPMGEVAAASAAGKAGTGYILSTISGHSIENVRAASQGPVFYQLYLMGGRGAAEAAIDRAKKAGCSGLVVTIDTPVAGLRERDFRNGIKELMGTSVFEKIPFLPQVLSRPGWLIGFLRDGGVPKLANVVVPGQGRRGGRSRRIRGYVVRFALDPRTLGRPHRREGRADRRRCEARDRRRRRRSERLQSRRTPARQRAAVDSCVARSGRCSEQPDRSLDGWRSTPRV